MKNKQPTIIVISGKAGNGKNLSAKIIQKIYQRKNKQTINLAYSFWIKQYAKNILGWDGKEESKPRAFLQEIGVDLIKNTIDKKMFVRRMIEDITVYSHYYDVITISDARFTEEIEELKKQFPFVFSVHIHGEKTNRLNDQEKKHISENALNHYQQFDEQINNIGTIEELEKKLNDMIERIENYE